MNETLTLAPHPSNPRARLRVPQGLDDGHAYRVVVPLRIRTVEAALAWLRPDGVPIDALRQGEFYFVPSASPVQLYCTAHEPGHHRYQECEGFEDGGHSSYTWTFVADARFSASHIPVICIAVVKSGSVAFTAR